MGRWNSLCVAHALDDGYGGFHMLNKLIEYIARPPIEPLQWGEETSNLIQPLDAYTDDRRAGKDISEDAKAAFEQAKEAYDSKGAVSSNLDTRFDLDTADVFPAPDTHASGYPR